MNLTRRVAITGALTAMILPALALTPARASTGTILYFFAHPDDELLQAGASIANHVALGRQVIVVSLTKGDAAKYRTTGLPGRLGRTPTPEEFGDRRAAEFYEAARRMGVPAHRARVHDLGDGKVTVASAKDVMRGYLARYPGAAVKAHSFLDAHRDHRNIGKALDDLYLTGEVSDARFYFSRRYAGQVPIPVSGTERSKVDLAAAQWSYRRLDTASMWWGIGYGSSGPLFDSHAADPYSIWHKPSDAYRSAADREAARAWVEAQGGYS